MSDTSLLFSILARSNLSKVLRADAISARALSGSLSAAKMGTWAASVASSAHAALALGAALAPTAGILAALPAAAVLAGGALATLKVAVSGVGEAFSAAATGTPEEFAESLKDLSPAARAVATEVRTLRPQIDALKSSVQSAMFRPLKGDITAVAAALGGPLKTGMSGVAAEFGRIGHGLARVARERASVSLVGSVFRTLKTEIGAAGGSLGPLLASARDFVSATLPAFGGLGNAVGGAADRLAVWLSNAASSGQAMAWIDGAMAAFSQLGTILGNLGSILGSVFGAMEGTGGGLLATLGQVTGMVSEFFASADGQSALTAVFSALGAVSAAAMPLLRALLAAVLPIVPVVAQLAGQLAGILGPALLQVVNAITPLIPPVVELIAQLLSGLMPIIPPLASLLASVASVLVAVLVPAVRLLTPVLTTVVGWIVSLADVIMSGLSAGISWLLANVPSAWQSVKSAIGSAVSAIGGIVGWFGSLPGKIGAWFTGAKNAAVNAWNALLAWIQGVPGKIVSGLGSLGSLLLGAGRALVQGLVNGVRNMAGAVVDAARGVVSGAINAAKSLLGIASPSRVFQWIGRMTSKGLVKGLLGSLSEVKSAAKKMSDTIIQAWERGRISRARASSLLTIVDRQNTRLRVLATQRDSIIKRLADARKLAETVAGNTAGSAALSSMDFGGRRITAGGIQSRLAAKLGRIQRFASVVKQLAARGLNKAFLRQVIGAGPDEGLPLAEALLAADAGMLGSLNSAQAAIDTASTGLGRTAADALYDSGAQAGRGFLTGLMAQQKSIEAAMDKLAKALVTRVRTALRIKSPSQVMAEVGVMSGLGFVGGVLSTLAGVGTAGERLAGAVVPPGNGVRPVISPPVPGAGPGGETITIRLVADGADSEMLRLLRKIVRVEGRGNVQVALGR